MNRLDFSDRFVRRHIGPQPVEQQQMLAYLGYASLDDLTHAAVPNHLRIKQPLDLPPSVSEFEALTELRRIAQENKLYRSYIGMGYSNSILPPVIQRNLLENPGWYTQYTPYQAEISQGRLEALLTFQTLVIDLTGLSIANASLLDEATAAAEAMTLCYRSRPRKREDVNAFFVSEACHPQTIGVVQTRAKPLGINVIVGDHREFDFRQPVFGVLLQYPATDGQLYDYRAFIATAHSAGALAVVAADLLALTLLVPPGELGADVATGSAQRFGVPLGYGGPHAAYMACKKEFKRQIPGRIVGVSKDVDGQPAIRLALQTREQHIRREKATSNICTAQVLLANIAAMYAVYHGPDGLRAIAERIHILARVFQMAVKRLGFETPTEPFFDTVRVGLGKHDLEAVLAAAEARRINLRVLDAHHVAVALDETVSKQDLQDLVAIFAQVSGKRDEADLDTLAASVSTPFDERFARKSAYLTHPVFNRYRSETEMMRYLQRLQAKDLSLTTSMIPLGSCTMKLNAAAEMLPITWPEFSAVHPFAPGDQVRGYKRMLHQLEEMLMEITGFAAISLQPNAGSQGEYTGLLVIAKYHQSRGEGHRNVCLIPSSAHGTNPASAALAGMKIVVVACDAQGNINVDDLKAKAKEHAANLAALMVTYPSTHGVFEESIAEICDIVHHYGGQVYMDGANLNAQVGLMRPADLGADVCHLNLHKTFSIPHGGGGPGMGPIGVAKHLVSFLPNHPVVTTGGVNAIGPVSAAPYGSASILPISWMYIRMMGAEGLAEATKVAILNANYIAKRLAPHYPVLYRGKNGCVAHECIFDLRHFKETAGIEVEDVAKRLMDYGFHAPTISFPVAGTLMVEPTESESLAELDRFCEAMIAIRAEIAEIEAGRADRENNVLKNAPHTAAQIANSTWNRPYSREQAAFPAPWLREHKFWPPVARINNVLGDRTLICACPPTEAYAEAAAG